VEAVSTGIQNHLASSFWHHDRCIQYPGQWIAEAANLFASPSIRDLCSNRPSPPFPQTMRKLCPCV
jgi:hypothetical protein